MPWNPDLKDGYLTTEAYEQLQHIKMQNLLVKSQKTWNVEVVSDLFNVREKKNSVYKYQFVYVIKKIRDIGY